MNSSKVLDRALTGGQKSTAKRAHKVATLITKGKIGEADTVASALAVETTALCILNVALRYSIETGDTPIKCCSRAADHLSNRNPVMQICRRWVSKYGTGYED